MDKNYLVGKKVSAAYINADRTTVRLLRGVEHIDLYTDADCCSESWIEHISGVSALLQGVIIGVEEVHIGEGVATRQESDTIYAFKLKLGEVHWDDEFAIEFRNSSNGYYGGSIDVRPGSSDLSGFSALTEDF